MADASTKNSGNKSGRLPEKDHFLKRLAALKGERASFVSHWQELSTNILPRRGRFLSSDTNRGSKKNSKIINDTATIAVRTLASGMMSGITSPARPWFRLGAPDPKLMDVQAVKDWLHVVEGRMREVFIRSNVYNALPVMYEELGVFGTAAMIVLADHEDVIRCYPLTAGEYFIANNYRNAVDTIYREVSMTVSQVIGQFGRENVSDWVKTAFDNGNVDQWVEIIHAVEPNDNRNPKMVDARNKRFLSVYFEKGGATDQFLRVSGFDTFAAMVPRWHLTGSDVYGRSPGMDALGDIKALQTEEKRKAQAIDKMVTPPVNAPGSMKNAAVTLLPGGINYLDASQGNQGVTPAYQVNPRIIELADDINRTEHRINRAFYADLFLMLSQSDRRQITAREIDERHEEKLLALGPMLERLHGELLDPLIDRTFDVMLNAGMLPPPPKELHGITLRVEYVSMLAQAQQAVGIGAVERAMGFVAQAAQMNPEVIDKFNFDQAVDEYGRMLGLPPSLILSDDAVSEKRKEREKEQNDAQARQQQSQMMSQMAEGAQAMMQGDGSGAAPDLTQMLEGVDPEMLGGADPEMIKDMVARMGGQGGAA
jgi:hypothetical protein